MLKDKDGFYNVVRVHEHDLRDMGVQREFTEQEMVDIAEKLGNALMIDFWGSLIAAVEDATGEELDIEDV